MNPERRRLALLAARRAYEVRRAAKIPLDHSCCVYDVVENAGVEVRFADLPSMEGVYYPSKPAIVVSSLRPQGRQAFSCAHEFGHHTYGHGEQFDELIEDRIDRRKYDPKEFEAECFAAALLMPKTAVLKGFADRSFHPATLTAEQVYRLASWLGVGYTTLLNHLARVLHLISLGQFIALEKVRLPAIRKGLLGSKCNEHLVVADEAWSGRPIDAQVSDMILLPPEAELEGTVLEVLRRNRTMCVARASKPGIGRVILAGTIWAHYTRISRNHFSGMARFRHLEEVDDE